MRSSRSLAWSVSLALLTALLFARSCPAQSALAPLTVFVLPTVSIDAVWMADLKGYYKDEGLDVRFRIFPTGGPAIQAFNTGLGDIVFAGDLPALLDWQQDHDRLQIITVLQRDDRGYMAMAVDAVKEAKDLVGRKVGTKVGSSGSWFLSEYLAKNGVDTGAVTVRDLDPSLLSVALCRGDIDAFFLFQPAGWRAQEICGDRVHQLTTAEGYMEGYTLAGARPAWLAGADGADKALRFLRATRKGADAARIDFAGLYGYVKQRFGLSEAITRGQYALNQRVLQIDQTFFSDFCNESRWLRRTGQTTGMLDFSSFAWMEGARQSQELMPVVPAPC